MIFEFCRKSGLAPQFRILLSPLQSIRIRLIGLLPGPKAHGVKTGFTPAP